MKSLMRKKRASSDFQKEGASFTAEFHDPHASNGGVWNNCGFSKEIHSTSLFQQEEKVVKSRGMDQAWFERAAMDLAVYGDKTDSPKKTRQVPPA
eukprot:13927960-Ditylum_brightwellii.AAC.1